MGARRAGPAAASLLAALLLLAAAPPRSAEGQVFHVYDRLNRLRATVDLTANDAAIWTYDFNGNLTNGGTKTYTWNVRDQLLSMTGASFQYDALAGATAGSSAAPPGTSCTTGSTWSRRSKTRR